MSDAPETILGYFYDPILWGGLVIHTSAGWRFIPERDLFKKGAPVAVRSDDYELTVEPPKMLPLDLGPPPAKISA